MFKSAFMTPKPLPLPLRRPLTKTAKSSDLRSFAEQFPFRQRHAQVPPSLYRPLHVCVTSSEDALDWHAHKHNRLKLGAETRTHLPESVSHVMLPQLYDPDCATRLIMHAMQCLTARCTCNDASLADTPAWAMRSFVFATLQCR